MRPVASPGRILRGGDWGARLTRRMASSPAGAADWVEQHTRLLKSDPDSRVGLLEMEEQPCFIKLYLAKSFIQRLGFRLGYGRGLRSFAAATGLTRAGLPVPQARACLLVPEGMVLLTEAIPETSDLRALWLAMPDPSSSRQLMGAAGEVLSQLHRAGFAHGDAKWSNLLWNGELFYLVDLEAVRRLRGGRAQTRLHARQAADLARFVIDAEELGASPEQLEYFLGAYLGGAACTREQLLSQLCPLLPPIRERHRRRYRTPERPLL